MARPSLRVIKPKRTAPQMVLAPAAAQVVLIIPSLLRACSSVWNWTKLAVRPNRRVDLHAIDATPALMAWRCRFLHRSTDPCAPRIAEKCTRSAVDFHTGARQRRRPTEPTAEDGSVGREPPALESEGILEHYWGEHIHLGYYTDEELDQKWFGSQKLGFLRKNFIEAKWLELTRSACSTGAASVACRTRRFWTWAAGLAARRATWRTCYQILILRASRCPRSRPKELPI